MLEWIWFGLVCYSIGLLSGFFGVLVLFLYAMKRMRKGFL
jgi:Na+/phosphate symporter